MGPSLRDQVWIYGNRDDQIYDTIAQGRANGMPAWGSKIPEEQIWELVAYIKSMRTPQEPDPPIEPADEMVPDPSGATQLSVGMQSSSSEVHEPILDTANQPNGPQPSLITRPSTQEPK
jgi:hypothetical protein